MMINREDMLELTRRMNLARNSFHRVAGSYRDEEGFEDGSFNVNFLNLSNTDKIKNIELAKSIPFSETNVELIDYEINLNDKNARQFKQMLDGIIESGLKNDALLEVFYDVVTDLYLPYHSGKDFCINVFNGVYDIKQKAADHEYLDSEEIYSFIICAICPVTGDYESGSPKYGFLYPSFRARSADDGHLYQFKSKTAK